MLETIRQYAIARLTAASEIDAIRERHARFYLGVAAQEACFGLTSGPERSHLDVIARIEDNMRVALDCLLRIEPSAALALSAGLTQFCLVSTADPSRFVA